MPLCQPRTHAGMVCHITWLVVPSPGAAMARIEAKWSSLKDTKPHEYAVRFVFGGVTHCCGGLDCEAFWTRRRRSLPCFPSDLSCERQLDREPRSKAQGQGRFRRAQPWSYGSQPRFAGSVSGLHWSSGVCLRSLEVGRQPQCFADDFRSSNDLASDRVRPVGGSFEETAITSARIAHAAG